MKTNEIEQGMKVKFKKGLKSGDCSSTNLTLWSGHMYDTVKEDPIMTVSLITDGGNFEVEENYFSWSPDWIEVVETIEKGDIVEFDDTVPFHKLRDWSRYTTEEMLSILNEHRTRPRFTVKSAHKYGFKVEENEWEWSPDWFFIVEKAKTGFELDFKDIIVLKGLKAQGFTRVARDEDGKLFTYKYIPEKGISAWQCRLDEDHEDLGWIGDDILNFVTWKDEEPYSIVWLLENAIQKDCMF